MRHLPYCETHVTDHNAHAWVVLAEVAAFVKAREAEGATVIGVELNFADEDATYYAQITIEVVPTVIFESYMGHLGDG